MAATKSSEAPGEAPTWLEGTRRSGLVAAAVASIFLFLGLGRSGVLDPYEVDRAELARRIAVHALGAGQLALEGDPASIPTLGDLNAGELGFTSMAWGLSRFGLAPWAGRLPLALWAFAGAAALFVLLARLARPRGALYAVIALVTMPAYFIQARTMLGDAVAMASFGLCLSGTSLAIFDEGSRRWRLFALAIAAAGAASGYLARGLLLGVAAPVGAVGLAWLLVARDASGPRYRSALGLFALATGGVAAAIVVASLAESGWREEGVTRAIGFSILAMPPAEGTFELPLRDLGHAIFPWSAFVPVAIGAIVARGRAGLSRGELALRMALVAAAITSFAAHAWLAPYSGSLPFVGITAVAGLVGLALADFELGEGFSPAAAIVIALLVALIHRDFVTTPEKSLAAFGLQDEVLPSLGAAPDHLTRAAIVFAFFAASASLGFPARGATKRWLAERRVAYRQAAEAVAGLWKGNLLFGFLLIEAALVGVAAMLVIGRALGWSSVMSISYTWARLGLNAWWLLPLTLAALPLGLDAMRLAQALVVSLLRLPRAGGFVAGALVAGAILCFGHYPAVAGRLSPKGAFDAYRSLRHDVEPLALLGLRTRGAHYHAGGTAVRSFAEPVEAHRWLLAGGRAQPPERRWLIFRDDDLAALNASHRTSTGQNLPVLASERPILLASNRLEGGRDENPLAPFLLAAPPAIQHPLDHRLGRELSVIGWSLRDEGGRLSEQVVPGQRYRLDVVFRVVRPLSRDYEVFLHIDGESRRHNGDHAPVGGMYPTSRWRPGDVVVDPYDLRLSPDFAPGRYRLYFGLFHGKERLAVTQGRHQADRIIAGDLIVP